MSYESNTTTTLPSIPFELIDNLIIPNLPVPWLRVSKKYNALAIKHVVNYPAFLNDPNFAVVSATYNKNYAMLDALLSDPRYSSPYIPSNAINICSSDRTANLLFLKHFFDQTKDRALSRAVTNDWIDVADYILNREDKRTIRMSFGCMSETMFERVIYHPKLAWTDACIKNLAKNTQIPVSTKAKILDVANVKMEAIMYTFSDDIFVDAFIADPRVIASVDLQKRLWEIIIGERFYDRPACTNPVMKAQRILTEKKLDPAFNFNLPLRLTLQQREFTEEKRAIAQLLLDDDRVILSLEPFKKNVIITILKASHSEEISAKIKFILNQPKFKREWFESTMHYLLFTQLEECTNYYDGDLIDPEIIFKKHQFDEYLSDEIRAKYPRAMKQLFKALAEQEGHYNEYYNKMAEQSDDD